LICWRQCLKYTYGFHVFRDISSLKPYRHRCWSEIAICYVWVRLRVSEL
jgi:hypothetical protein